MWSGARLASGCLIIILVSVSLSSAVAADDASLSGRLLFTLIDEHRFEQILAHGTEVVQCRDLTRLNKVWHGEGPPANSPSDPAINHQRLPGDISGRGTRQKQDRRCHFIRCT